MSKRLRWLSRRTFIGLLLIVVSVSAIAVMAATGRFSPRTPICVMPSSPARGILQGCYMYAQEPTNPHPHHFPKDLATLVRGNYFTIDYLLSPGSDKYVPSDFQKWPIAKQDGWIHKNSSYVLIPGLVDDIDPKKVALFQKPEDSYDQGGYISVAFNDVHVVRMMPVAEAEKLIQAQTGKTIQQLVDAAERDR